MESIIKYVVGELSTIAHAPVAFIAAILILGTAAWWALDWRYSGIIANRDAELSSAKVQRDDYKDKLQGATPDQAKARIDALEARLANVEPRRLNNEQRTKLIEKLRLPPNISYKIAIGAKASGDSLQYQADIVGSFAAAGNWIVNEYQAMGIGSRPPSGFVVRFGDLNNPPPEAAIVVGALRAAAIQFDIQSFKSPNAPVDLFICTKITR
jgi:hypothetical protein